MVFRIVCLSLALAITASSSPDSRIVGGTPTTIYEFPFIVSIEYITANVHEQRCVGALISSYHVLTAGFCFSDSDYANMHVRAGSTTSLSGGTVVSIGEIIQHPFYQASPRAGDITIVVLSRAMGITDSINTVYIPPQQTYIPDGYPVQVTSWGFEGNEGPPTDILKTFTTNVISQSACVDAYENSDTVVIDDYVLCSAAEGKSTCHGDSGAPMVIGQTLVGLSSYFGSCDDSTPDVFTRVDRHTGWILEHAVAPSGRAAGVPVRVRTL